MDTGGMTVHGRHTPEPIPSAGNDPEPPTDPYGLSPRATISIGGYFPPTTGLRVPEEQSTMTVLKASDGTAGHGPHVPEPQPDCQQVVWLPVTQVDPRRRVLRWTCQCKPVVYYLIASGGRGYIERTGQGRTTVETSRMRYTQTGDLWELILLGRAH
ncbi:hypothetical protein Ssi03_59380 [Sphaerisporangium siamense]|uniref:Uncharacterized protein n=1 Tax=Sphaerisporangium siamense TaxID=795645 RepID=A0A7W7D6E9_9ACTN|nr:hypothetical protein [Sphaerisporangium siamense]MBB4699768.1 hypothetical protein [Sphaerisporangium siamense]GII87948.1 hypothetical protein Ssi03_59380 [Sphaerisporangium siamense]